MKVKKLIALFLNRNIIESSEANETDYDEYEQEGRWRKGLN